MAMLNLTSEFSGFDSDSSYPRSSPTDSGVESSPGVRAAVAAVPDSKLRAIIIKLAESSPQFHRAIMKELGCAQASAEASPITPTTPKARSPRRHRSKPSSHRGTLTISTQTAIHNHKRNDTVTEYQSDCVYHPGNLEEEVYEFLSGTDDTRHTVVRTLTMWSCCDEDEWSPGCMSVAMIPAQYKVEHDDRYNANLSHNDVFSDSDLE